MVPRAISVELSERQVTLLALGDWGTGSSAQQRVAAAMSDEAKRDPRALDAVLMLGDNFYGDLYNDTDPQWQHLFESMYDHTALHAPFYAVLGNHDYEHRKDLIELGYAQKNPTSRWKLPGRWYRLQLPEENPIVTILVLDSNVAELPAEMFAAQNRWLAEQLQQARTTPWLVVAAHHPLHSSGRRADHRLIDAWAHLMNSAHVDFYLCGHEHSLEHFQFESTEFLICGAGGAKPREITPRQGSRFQLEANGFLELHLGERSADISFIDDRGRVVHSFSRLAAKH